MKTSSLWLTIAASLFLMAGPAQAQLVKYTFGTAASPTANAAITNAVTPSAFGYAGALSSAGVATLSGNPAPQYAAIGWDGNSGNTKYFNFTITPLAGASVSLSSLNLDTHISKTGGQVPTTFDVYYVIGAGTPTLVQSGLSTGTTSWPAVPTITLSGIAALQNVSSSVTFRLVGKSASGGADGWGVDNVTLNGKATPVITWANPADITYGTALSGTQLNATTTVAGIFAYTPVSGTVLNAGNGQTLSVTFTPTDAVNYNSASATVSINVNKATPVISWSNPADITYGAALNSTQLNATAGGVAGGFVYTPASGTVLNAGNAQTLSAQFTPTDTANYSTPLAQIVTINVGRAALTVKALDASKTYDGLAYHGGNGVSCSGYVNGENSNVLSGTLTFNGSSQGAINAGAYAITPVGLTNGNYNIAFADGSLTIDPATPTLTWGTPTDIGYGTALGGVQLNATAGVAGALAYNPASGALLNAGKGQTLSVTFTPTDTNNYAPAGANVSINVNPAPLTITADSKSKTQGLPNPALTASYDGFVNGEKTNVLTTQATLITTANVDSPPAAYSITASGAAAANYTISYVGGTLTVVAPPDLGGLSAGANQFTLAWPTLAGQTYQVEYKDNLDDPAWTPLGTSVAGTDNPLTLNDDNNGAAHRFYRLKITQP